MKDTRYAEVAWLTVIAIVVALGGNVVLGLLASHRVFAAVLLAALAAAALFALRRAVVGTPSDRVEVTKAATYLTAAALAFVAIGLHVHWAIGASIAAVEAALVFDIITIIARRTPAHGE